MAKLIINPTSSSRREIALARTIVSIGRDPSNDVVLPDAMVSRRHAVIEYRGSQYFLRDCNSSNGSLVNGDRVSERNLRDGDLVAIGTARLLFREEMEEAGAKVVPHPSAPRQVCPSCQSDYRKGDMFCRQCGASLAPSAPARVVCTSCGTAVLMPARYCNACGHPLKDDAASGEGETSDATKPRPLSEPPAPDEGASGSSSADAPAAGSVAPAAPPAAAAPGAPDSESGAQSAAAPALGAPPPAGAAASPAEVPPPPRLARPLADNGPSRSSPVEEMARPGAPALRAAPAAAPLVGPRPAPQPLRGRPERAEPARRPQPPPPRPAVSAPPASAPAGFGVRAVAGLVDGLLVSVGQVVLAGPVAYYWWDHWWAHPPATAADVAFWPILVSLILVPVVLALGAVYYVYYWGVQGATPGKRLLGLVVQAEDGSVPIGLSRAAIRVLGYLLSGFLLGIGFLMIALSGAGLHDRLAGTRVVRRERS
jgi:uncharacterized RDD family membrane protein YckC